MHATVGHEGALVDGLRGVLEQLEHYSLRLARRPQNGLARPASGGDLLNWLERKSSRVPMVGLMS